MTQRNLAMLQDICMGINVTVSLTLEHLSFI